MSFDRNDSQPWRVLSDRNGFYRKDVNPMTNEPRPTTEEFQQAKAGGRTWKEELSVAGNQLADEAKRLVHEGNVRTLRIKHDGRVLVELPVTAAAGVGAV